MIRLWLDDAWFSSQQGQENILFSKMSRQALGSTQPPIQWVPSVLSLGVKWLQGEVHCSPPSSAKVKNECSYIATPLHTICLQGLERESFTSLSIVKPTRCTSFSNLFYFILVYHSTCFGQSFHPSSGVQDCTYSNRYMSNRYCYLLASGNKMERSSISFPLASR